MLLGLGSLALDELESFVLSFFRGSFQLLFSSVSVTRKILHILCTP